MRAVFTSITISVNKQGDTMFRKKKGHIIIKVLGNPVPLNSPNGKPSNPLLKIRGKEPLQMPDPQQALKEKKLEKPLPTKTIGKIDAKRTGVFVSVGHPDKEGLYEITASSSFLQGQKAIGKFEMPYSASKWKTVLDELDRSVQNPRTAMSAVFPVAVRGRKSEQEAGEQVTEQKPLIETVGRDLFDALFSNEELKEIYAESALQAEAMFPICIETDQPDIARLPWEYMHDSYRYLCLEIGPIFRIVPGALPGLGTLKQPGELKILIAPSNPPGSVAIDYGEEIANIQDRLRNTGNLVAVPQRQDVNTFMQNALEYEADIIHFIGHGDDDGLLFRDSGGNPIPVGDVLGPLVQALKKPPQMVIFNACYTGTANVAERRLGLAAQLVNNRVPIVVAMQFSISDSAAKVFSQGFYEYLAAGFPLHRASVWGRVAIKMSLRDTYEWATPIVYVNPRLNLG